jgi:hypothetical protein
MLKSHASPAKCWIFLILKLRAIFICRCVIFALRQVIAQSQALNVLNNKKGRAKKRDKHVAEIPADHSESGAAAALSDASDGTDEAVVVALESGENAAGGESQGADAGTELKET